MVSTDQPHDEALALFRKQLDCLVRDDKVEQMKLYAEDLLYEFPFATDRPKRIEGREAFEKVMTPLWAAARERGYRITGSKYEFHATDEAGLYVARFTLTISAAGKTVPLPFVQFLRIRNGKIVEASEYFNPQARAQLSSTG